MEISVFILQLYTVLQETGYQTVLSDHWFPVQTYKFWLVELKFLRFNDLKLLLCSLIYCCELMQNLHKIRSYIQIQIKRQEFIVLSLLLDYALL